jgi:hypothetical protein
MPLINFRTNLTSLRFGMDQPGGGDSGQPFIQAPIENANTPTEFKDFYTLNRTSLDFPIRGGAISSLVNGTYTTQAAIIDTKRIKKFFASRPQGDTFINKQKNLQLTNPKTQVPNSLQFVGISLDNAVIPVTQVYNPANTLAQVAASGTGAHFNRHGVNPTIYESVYQTYQHIAGTPVNNTEVTNRLAILRALKLIGNTNFLINSSTATGLGIDPALVDRLGISTIQNQLFNYPGGPGSNYGIGFTRIFRATDTNITTLSQTRPDPRFTANGSIANSYSAIAFTYQQLAQQTGSYAAGKTPLTTNIQDFRNQLPAVTARSAGTARSDYSLFNIANKNNGSTKKGLGIGNPGSPDDQRSEFNLPRSTNIGSDLLNLNPFFYYTQAGAGAQTPWTAGGDNTKDIIKFAFECIDNNNPSQAIGLVFRAFFDGQISDSNTAEYNTFKYLGRGETFRTYQGFDRTIGFTFKVFCQSRQEMQPLYTKLNNLVSQVYPDYSPTSNLMRGNVVRLTIGDYIYRMPGFLENVNITIDNSNTPWETKLKGDLESDVAELPHMVTVACSFKPIMDILPRKARYNDLDVPLIANGPVSGSSLMSQGPLTPVPVVQNNPV